MLSAAPDLCYAPATVPAGVSTNASYEASSAGWPRADGVVSILEAGRSATQRDIALEYKRRQEGVHGLLTAIGQAHAYLHKGYNGAAIVVPGSYPTLGAPGTYVRDVLDGFSQTAAIGVFEYDDPDPSSATPFAGRLHCVRHLELITVVSAARPSLARPKTQWMHMREGSTIRDAFFRFLQVAKRLSADGAGPPPSIPRGLQSAIARLAPGRDPAAYLANVADDRFLSRVWKQFWFEWAATPEVLTPWTKVGGVYVCPNAFTRIDRDDGAGKSQLFEGRSNGLKENIVADLNSGAIAEPEGWELFADGISRPGQQRKQGVRDRAHSYREDLDSALSHLEWIDTDGRPTDYGYHYMAICERFGGANSVAAVEYVGASLLQTGRYAAFLHYVNRLSEAKFAAEPLAFSRTDRHGRPTFNEQSYAEYLAYLEEKMADDLKVMRKVTGRARPRTRTPFQAELTLLRRYRFVSRQRHRLGIGIPIDWERVLEALRVEL